MVAVAIAGVTDLHAPFHLVAGNTVSICGPSRCEFDVRDKQSMHTSGGRRRQFLRHSFTICTDPKPQQPVRSRGRRSSCCVYALEATPMAEAGK